MPIFKTYESDTVTVKSIKKEKIVYFKNFRILKNEKSYEYVKEFVDTIHTVLKVKEESTRLWSEGCSGEWNKKWLYKTEQKTLYYKDWNFTKGNLNQSDSWAVDSKEEEYKIKKASFVIKGPCDPRESIYPAMYITAILVYKKGALSQEQETLLYKYTSDSLKYEYTDFERSSFDKKSYVVSENRLKVIEEAKIISVEVYTEKEINKIKKTIFNKLIAKNIIQKDEKINIKNLKIGLLKYQYENHFPIGQFDKKTIDYLLNN